MPKFEYLIANETYDKSRHLKGYKLVYSDQTREAEISNTTNVLILLDELGEQGWELCSIVKSERTDDYGNKLFRLQLYCKRQKEEK